MCVPKLISVRNFPCRLLKRSGETIAQASPQHRHKRLARKTSYAANGRKQVIAPACRVWWERRHDVDKPVISTHHCGSSNLPLFVALCCRGGRGTVSRGIEHVLVPSHTSKQPTHQSLDKSKQYTTQEHNSTDTLSLAIYWAAVSHMSPRASSTKAARFSKLILLTFRFSSGSRNDAGSLLNWSLSQYL